MGEVDRARDTRLGRTVALEFLPEAFAQDREWREPLRIRESRWQAVRPRASSPLAGDVQHRSGRTPALDGSGHGSHLDWRDATLVAPARLDPLSGDHSV